MDTLVEKMLEGSIALAYNATEGGEAMAPEKLPSWIMSLYNDAKAETPNLSLEAFASEYLELDELGEYHLKKRPTFRCAQPLEKQKFGRDDQADLFDQLDEAGRELATRQAVEVVGLDLTLKTHAVFTAIQKLISERYWPLWGGNLPPRPRFEVTPSEFAEAYGVKRQKTKRGKNELQGWGYREAINDLDEARQKQFLFWKEELGADGKRETVVGIRPAFLYEERWKDLTPGERRAVANRWLLKMIPEGDKDERAKEAEKNAEKKVPLKKLIGIIIDPDPIFSEEYQRRFVVKDLNYLEEVKQLAGGRKAKYPVLFVDLLQLKASENFVGERGGHRKEWIFDLRVSTLATKLRMDPWIKTRNFKQIREAILRCGEIAFKAGYLTEPGTIKTRPTGQVFVARMNRDKFTLNLELDEKRAQYEKRIREAEYNEVIEKTRAKFAARRSAEDPPTPPPTLKTPRPLTLDEQQRNRERQLAELERLTRQHDAEQERLSRNEGTDPPPNPTTPDAA